MSGKRIRYLMIVSLISFLLWFLGEMCLMIFFPESSMTVARVWVVLVFSAACAWSLFHFHREEKRQKEDEENDNYKGVY